jgi:hypothetical protein
LAAAAGLRPGTPRQEQRDGERDAKCAGSQPRNPSTVPLTVI